MSTIPLVKIKIKTILLCLIAVGCATDDIIPVCYLSSDGSHTYAYTNNRLTSGAYYGAEYTVKYDQENRAAEIDYALGGKQTFSYDDRDHIISAVQTWSTGQVQTSYYTFNSTGQMMSEHDHFTGSFKDSTVFLYSYPNTSTHNYSSAIEIDYNHSDDPNVIVIPVAILSYTYEYDNMKNPYSSVDINAQNTDNNQTKVTTTLATLYASFTPIADTTTSTYRYTYNSRGYPLTVAITTTNTSGRPTYTYTGTYTYSNCK